MSTDVAHARNPYAGSPGGSSPGPEVDEAEGNDDLRSFTYLSLASTGILTVVANVGWLLVHH
jgi:hypothetical protein